jgi:hypothetical protein
VCGVRCAVCGLSSGSDSFVVVFLWGRQLLLESHVKLGRNPRPSNLISRLPKPQTPYPDVLWGHRKPQTAYRTDQSNI